MGPLPNLIYYSSISTRRLQVIAEYLDGDDELPVIAAKCLELVPSLHNRFSYTTNGLMFACIVDKSFRFYGIMDEALARSKALSFLEQLRQEFNMLSSARGLPVDDSNYEPHCLDNDFDPIFRRLATPYVGIPQKEKERMEEESDAQCAGEGDEIGFLGAPTYGEYDHSENVECHAGSRSPSTPLIGKTNSNKFKQKKGKDQTRDTGDINKNKPADKVHRLEIMSDASSQQLPNQQMQKLASMKKRGQQLARRMWWRNVKLVLTLDAFICVVLFGIWLVVCKGFSCMQKTSD